jgi:zinc protease
VQRLAAKWFGPIPSREKVVRNLPSEPAQQEARRLEVESDVPLEAIYRVYHMCDKLDADYYPTDLLSDVLGRGKASRLYQQLVKEQQIFNSISAYITGSFDAGLLTISGKLQEGHSPEAGEAALDAVLANLLEQGVEETELDKAKNQAEATLVFSEMEVLNRTINLAQAALLGKPELINEEPERIASVTTDQVNAIARSILRPENASTLAYQKKAVV